MMDDPKSIVVIALCLRSTSLRTRCLASEILGAVCLIPKGHNYVLQALTDFKDIAGETKRFETIVRDLILDRRRQYKNELLDRDLQLASLSLINALISGGYTKFDIEFRTHLRYEFTNLGILEILEVNIKKKKNWIFIFIVMDTELKRINKQKFKYLFY